MGDNKRKMEEGYQPTNQRPKDDVQKGFQPAGGADKPKPKPPNTGSSIKPPPPKKE